MSKTDEIWHDVAHEIENGSFTRVGEILTQNGVDLVRLLVEHNASDAQFEEAFACACLNGDVATAVDLLDRGVDPASVRSGQSGFHYAAMRGDVELVETLLARGVPLETINQYEATVLGQALWSAMNEPMPGHGPVIEQLIEGGAHVWPGTLEWWYEQAVPSVETKERVAEALRRHSGFHEKLGAARAAVAEARNGDKSVLAHALKEVGNIERRPPYLRGAALATYTEAAVLYRGLQKPLDEAWVLRHIGIIHEYAERLELAEQFYDQALTLYRQYSEDDLNYANAVRYPAVIKERLGKDVEAIALWEESLRRYRECGIEAGIDEAVTHLATLKNKLTI